MAIPKCYPLQANAINHKLLYVLRLRALGKLHLLIFAES